MNRIRLRSTQRSDLPLYTSLCMQSADTHQARDPLIKIAAQKNQVFQPQYTLGQTPVPGVPIVQYFSQTPEFYPMTATTHFLVFTRDTLSGKCVSRSTKLGSPAARRKGRTSTLYPANTGYLLDSGEHTDIYIVVPTINDSVTLDAAMWYSWFQCKLPRDQWRCCSPHLGKEVLKVWGIDWRDNRWLRLPCLHGVQLV